MFQIYYTVRSREMSRKRRCRIATAPFEFEVESLMFDVDGFEFKAIASNIIHQTSNMKEKGTSHDGRNLRALVAEPLPCLLFKDVLGQAHGFISEDAFVHGLQVFGDVRYEFHLIEDVLLQIYARCDFRED